MAIDREIPEEGRLFESGLIPVEESRKAAHGLLEKYNSQILSQQLKDVNGWGNRIESDFYQNAIRHYLKEQPEEVLKQYWGHGVKRGEEEDRLTVLLNILSNSAIKGDCGQLVSSYISAYDDGDFLLILDKDRPFPPRLQDGTMARNQIGLKVNIGVLVVNTRFYPLVEELKKIFPNRKIIKANELPEYF
jgi:hypothetical protein